MPIPTSEYSESLRRFIADFVGYGPATAKTWFLGPEQAGIDCVKDLLKTLRVWEELGGTPLVDLYEFHAKLGVTKIFGDNPPTQATWRKLIRIALTLEGIDPVPKQIRTYQAKRLGRLDGDVLLGELLPLPKKKLNAWPYAELQNEFPELATRETYLDAVLPLRIAMLQAFIREHRPERVFFYGTTGLLSKAWREVAGCTLGSVDGGYWVGEAHGTRYVMLSHPTALGRGNAYFDRAANLA